MELSKNNTKSLQHFYRHYRSENEMKMFQAAVDTETFHKNRQHFKDEFLKNERLRILDISSDRGKLSVIEHLCLKVEAIKRHFPSIQMIAIDYLQLLTVERQGRMSRDEALKEICVQLKDVAAKTGIVIVTAAQFNRTIQNEEDLHPSAIGEAGSIERHAALVIGVWNRSFQQFKGGTRMDRPIKNEMLLDIMLNRHGTGGHRFVIPYNGNIGKLDFQSSKLEGAENASSEGTILIQARKGNSGK